MWTDHGQAHVVQQLVGRAAVPSVFVDDLEDRDEPIAIASDGRGWRAASADPL
jgi:hypothetical protein